MALMVKQTLKNKGISFWKILLMIVVTVMIMNITIQFFSVYGAVIGSIAAIISLAICTMICIKLIYKNLAHFNYRLIDDELMVERVIGRANHLFFHVNLKDIKLIKSYNKSEETPKDVKTYKFVVDADKAKWYVIEFLKDNETYRLILEPNEAFLKALSQNTSKELKDENRVISS